MLSNHHRRYDELYLVNVSDMDDLFVEEPNGCCYCCRQKKKKIFIIIFIVLLLLFILAFLSLFVVFPLVFKYSLSLQQTLIFTRFGLPSDKIYFEEIWFPGFQNRYVSVENLQDATNKTLGVYQILPTNLTYLELNTTEFDYDSALENSSYPILLYFHGTGETRADNLRKYQILRFFFQIIAFDYRSYGDSSKGVLSEKTVVNDCVQLFKWVKAKTNSSIYLWGHSLGSALATHTLMNLEKEGLSVTGLILESSFTTMAEEIVVNPITKYLSWLPWFSFMVLQPLKENGFIFDTKSNIMNVHCPIMILHSKDDDVVPYTMSNKLYDLASNRSNVLQNETILHIYGKNLDYDHIYIYVDPYLPFYILDFMNICKANEKIKTENISRNLRQINKHRLIIQ